MAILLFGVIVGLILTTQKNKLNIEPQAAGICTLKCSRATAGLQKCINNWIYTCVYSQATSQYYLRKEVNCASQPNQICQSSVANNTCVAECVDSNIPNPNHCDIDGDLSCSEDQNILKQCVDGLLKDYKDCSKWNKACGWDPNINDYGCVTFANYSPTPSPQCDEGKVECIDNAITRCTGGQWITSSDCSANNMICAKLTSTIAFCYPNIIPGSSPVSQPKTCKSPNFCATRTECKNDNGKVVAGKCGSTNEICCNTYVPAGECTAPNDCSTRYECQNDGGSIVSGSCGAGLVCCKY